MLAFQLIGWVLIALFFGAMIGCHQRPVNFLKPIFAGRRITA
jgi:D-alanyl-lipoteichoic acid acyltransferase DltB (MBOAT superfamily)